MNKVILIGCGNVGMSYAFCLINSNSKVDELVLIDVDKSRAEGEALDLLHASSCSAHKIKIKSGDYSDCKGADIICIAAGRNQEIGETRNDLVNKNLAVFKSIIDQVNKTSFSGIYLIATNPLDVMTYVTLKLSKAVPNRVIGSGTTLDTARLRYLISEELNVNPKNIHAYVIGEHGDSEFIPWSNTVIGLKNATDLINKKIQNKILKEVRNSAYEIISKKGNTAYGIGMCLKNITEAILSDSNAIYTVSTYNPKLDICVGLPTIINRTGIRETIMMDMNTDEINQFKTSCKAIKSVIDIIKDKL